MKLRVLVLVHSSLIQELKNTSNYRCQAYHEHRGDIQKYRLDTGICPRYVQPGNVANRYAVVVVGSCDEKANVRDLEDLRLKAEHHRDNLACMMITVHLRGI
ncbi:MAG: hypothetical protein R2766_05510 [Saprospiraceae bacterium]